jgi:hypothetical protein
MDSFHTIAEIAATFVGFAGIIVAINSSRPGSDSLAQQSKRTLPGIFWPCLSAIFFAFLPELIFGGVPAGATEWRIACGVFGLIHLPQSLLPILLATNVANLDRGARWLIVLSQPAVWLAIAVALGFLVDYAYQIYLFGLIWYLVVAMNSFIRFVRRISDQ